MIKKTAIFISILLVFFCTLSVEAATSSGTCGDTSTWVLDESGTLTISGTGGITNNSYKSSYGSYIKKIIIEEGITSICNYAFSDCRNVETVELPEGLQTIGTRAFDCCVSLTSINIPSSVENVGDYPFVDCVKLTDIIVAESNQYYASVDGVLFNKDKTTLVRYPTGKIAESYVVPSGVMTIGKQSFGSAGVDINTGKATNGYCKLTKIELPDSISKIEAAAFSLCRDLQYINIPDSLESIESGIFRGCFALKEIHIPDGITKIGSSAFFNCKNLTMIYIPNSITTIDMEAFRNNDSLEKILYDGLPTEWENITIGTLNFSITNDKIVYLHQKTDGIPCVKPGISEYWLGYDGIGYYSDNERKNKIEVFDHTIIVDAGKNATCTETGLTDGSHCDFCGEILVAQETIPIVEHTDINTDGICDICNGFIQKVLASGTCGDNVSWQLGEDYTLLIRGSGKMADYTNVSFASWYKLYKEKIKSVLILPGITHIGNYAFEGCSKISNITIPNSVISIGEGSFRSCTPLTTVVIPDSITSIGSYAFSGCKNLKEIHISDIAKWCNIDFGSAPFPAGDLYLNGECIKTLTIPYGVNTIKKWAFYNFSKIETVSMPNTLTEIGEYSFRNCTGLTSVIIPENVIKIDSWAFKGCTGLESITIPKTIKELSLGSFDGCENLNAVHISDIAKWCDIVFVSSYYYGYTYYSSNPLYYAGNLYLNGILVNDLVIPEGTTTIRERAFDGGTCIKNIAIPKSVSNIGENAFRNCTGLKNIYYNSSNEKWSSITKGKQDTYWENATISFNCVPFIKATVSSDKKAFTITPIFAESEDVVILALYKDKRFVKLYQTKYQNEAVQFNATEDYDEVKIMVWESFKTLVPVCEANSTPTITE